MAYPEISEREASPEVAAPGRGRTLAIWAAKKSTAEIIKLKWLRQLRGGTHQPHIVSVLSLHPISAMSLIRLV